MKKILFLSYTGMTDPLGQSQVLAYLKGLSEEHGYEFTIISFEKPNAFKSLKTNIEIFCKEANIKWYPLPYTSKPPVLSTFLDVRKMRKLALHLHKTEKFSLVHCRSYIPSLVGLQLKNKKKIPFLFDMRGFWADERIDGGIWKKSNPLFNFIFQYFKKKEKQFLIQADHIVSLTQNAKNEILSWKLTSTELPIKVIPCCVDTNLFNPKYITEEQKRELRLKLDIDANVPVISYIGSLGTWYMLPEMLQFVKKIQQVYPRSIFLILTGEPKELVYTAAKQYEIDIKSIRIKKVARNEMPLHISLSTLSLFFIKPAFSKKASSPVKQGEIMAMGVPVICNSSVGDTEEIVLRYHAGMVVNDFTDRTFEKVIADFQQKQFDSTAITEGANTFFSLSHGVKLYQEVYTKILHAKEN